MIDSFAGAVGASLTHDVFLYLIYAFSAVLLAIPIVMAVAAITAGLRTLERRRLATVCIVSGGLGLTAVGAVALAATQ